MDTLKFREFYKRRLPHFQIQGASYFITFRLLNSLPAEVLKSLRLESERIRNLPQEEADQAHRRWFGKYDSFLDKCIQGEPFLNRAMIADMVAESIRFREADEYNLFGYCIMPNHVHMVIGPKEKSPDVYYGLGEILHSLKRYTARQANIILGRNGPFWQSESYDRVIRDPGEFARILQYLLNNPVKAGLTDDWSKWKWSYCRYDI